MLEGFEVSTRGGVEEEDFVLDRVELMKDKGGGDGGVNGIPGGREVRLQRQDADLAGVRLGHLVGEVLVGHKVVLSDVVPLQLPFRCL